MISQPGFCLLTRVKRRHNEGGSTGFEMLTEFVKSLMLAGGVNETQRVSDELEQLPFLGQPRVVIRECDKESFSSPQEVV